MSQSADITALRSALESLADPDAPLLSIATLVASIREESCRPLLLDAIIEATGAERAFLLEGSDDGTFRALAARTLDREDILNPLEKVVLPIAERAVERNQEWWTGDLGSEPEWQRLERERQPKTRSLLLIPLGTDRRLLYLDHRFGEIPSGCVSDPRVALISLAFAFARSGHHEPVENNTRRGKRSGRGTAGSSSTSAIEGDDSPPIIIGRHPKMIEIRTLIDRVAASRAPILVTGESGTGKELIARSIHRGSNSAAGPFVSENCGAIAENLIETELFGCVKGAYTGATEDRPGLFELANGGTIFLDEIGDTTSGLQKKLLRVLQEGMVRRVGGSELIPVKVRVVSATNRDLNSEVARGNFREDLFYRLNVINIHLPPLRERQSDIPLIAEHILEKLNEESGESKSYTPRLLEALARHRWPGNIRELQNELRRVHALSEEELDPEKLSIRVREETPTPAVAGGLDDVIAAGSLRKATSKMERLWLEEALRRFGGNRAQVCQALGIPKTTLYAKMRRYHLDRPDSGG